MRRKSARLSAAAVALVLAYLLGSISVRRISRAGCCKGIDLRKHGSGNLGATNVLRVLGCEDRRSSCSSFDAREGRAAGAALARGISATRRAGRLGDRAAASRRSLGHVRPIFLCSRAEEGRRDRGRGVPRAAPMATLRVARRVRRRASLAHAATCRSAVARRRRGAPGRLLALTHGVRQRSCSPSASSSRAFVFWTHRANIGRLRRGEEHGSAVGRKRRNRRAAASEQRDARRGGRRRRVGNGARGPARARTATPSRSGRASRRRASPSTTRTREPAVSPRRARSTRACARRATLPTRSTARSSSCYRHAVARAARRACARPRRAIAPTRDLVVATKGIEPEYAARS